MTKPISRFDPCGHCDEMLPTSDGDFVRYEDYLAAISDLKAEIFCLNDKISRCVLVYPDSSKGRS